MCDLIEPAAAAVRSSSSSSSQEQQQRQQQQSGAATAAAAAVSSSKTTTKRPATAERAQRSNHTQRDDSNNQDTKAAEKRVVPVQFPILFSSSFRFRACLWGHLSSLPLSRPSSSRHHPVNQRVVLSLKTVQREEFIPSSPSPLLPSPFSMRGCFLCCVMYMLLCCIEDAKSQVSCIKDERSQVSLVILFCVLLLGFLLLLLLLGCCRMYVCVRVERQSSTATSRAGCVAPFPSLPLSRDIDTPIHPSIHT